MTSRRSRSYALAAAVAAGTVLFLVWGIGALGIIGRGGRPDLLYVAVLAVMVVGTVVARLRPAGMARALVATALTQLLIAFVALAAGLQHTAGASVGEILGLNAMYAALFAWSAWLFARAAQERPSAAPVGGH